MRLSIGVLHRRSYGTFTLPDERDDDNLLLLLLHIDEHTLPTVVTMAYCGDFLFRLKASSFDGGIIR